MKADNYNNLVVKRSELVRNFKRELELFFKIYEITHKILENIERDKLVDAWFEHNFDTQYLQKKTEETLLKKPITPVETIAWHLGFFINVKSVSDNKNDGLVYGELNREEKKITLLRKKENKLSKFEENYVIAKLIGEYLCSSEIEEENLNKKSYIDYVSDLFALMLLMPPKKYLEHQIAYIKNFWEIQMQALNCRRKIYLGKESMLMVLADAFDVSFSKVSQYQLIVERMLYISKIVDFCPDNPLKQELMEMHNDPDIMYFYDPKPRDVKTKYDPIPIPYKEVSPCKPHYYVGPDGRAR